MTGVVQVLVGLPDSHGGEFGAVLPQLLEQSFDHVVADFRAAGRGLKIDGERVYVVLVFTQVVGKFQGERLGVFGGVAVPLGAGDAVQVVVDDGLLLVAADAVDQLHQLAVEDVGGLAHQLVAGLVSGAVAGVGAFR